MTEDGRGFEPLQLCSYSRLCGLRLLLSAEHRSEQFSRCHLHLLARPTIRTHWIAHLGSLYSMLALHLGWHEVSESILRMAWHLYDNTTPSTTTLHKDKSIVRL